MRLPKLKYYYHACNPQEYAAFETTRRLDITDGTEINIDTGEIRSRPVLVLAAGAAQVDTVFRQDTEYLGALFVLRIPREYILRELLTPISEGVYHYRGSLLIPHCGVEKIELDPDHIAKYSREIEISGAFSMTI